MREVNEINFFVKFLFLEKCFYIVLKGIKWILIVKVFCIKRFL